VTPIQQHQRVAAIYSILALAMVVAFIVYWLI
jgi:hypothetical protein